MPIRRALLSVSDKTGLVGFARELAQRGVALLSTGGTFKALAAAGIAVETVESYTGSPEVMDGRVKTLHPKVHGALLARRDVPAHLAACAEHGIELIDLVVVNLYPFAATIARPDVTLEEAIEQIDIGGPSMLRSSAKNHAAVTVVCNPGRYDEVLAELRAGDGQTTERTRRRLACEVFAHTSEYDRQIAEYLVGTTAAG